MKLLCLFLADSLPVLWCFFALCSGLLWDWLGLRLLFLWCFFGVSLVKKQRNSKEIRIYKITWFLP